MQKDEKKLPIYSETGELGSKGIRMVADAVEDELHWIFRVKEKTDIGIDGEIERIDNRKSTGELLAVQIKCGQSFFKEISDLGYVFRCTEEKVNYWLSLSIPVILCLCNNEKNKVYWCHITVDTVHKLKCGYKIIVPFSNVLNQENIYKLELILETVPSIDVISDAAIFRYLCERYKNNIVINSVVETPRDFHNLSYLATINGDTYLIGAVIDRYGYFDINDVIKIIRLYHKNRESFGWAEYNVESKFLICFVSESIEHLQLKNNILELLDNNAGEVTYSRLHLDRKYLSAVLVREDGAEIWFYNQDGTIDDGLIFSTHIFIKNKK